MTGRHRFLSTRTPSLSVIAAILLLTPLATANDDAASAYSSFTITGDAQATGEALALLQNDTSAITSLSITGFSGSLCTYSVLVAEPTGSSGVSLVPDQHCYLVTQAQVTMTGVGQRDGWVGVMPATGNRATLNTTSLSATATPSQRVTSKDAASAHSADTDAPEYRYYAKTITTPHLDTSGPGTATYAGSGLTRILGLNLHIKSAEGEMDIQTGTTTTSTLLGEAVTVSWVALDLNGATLALTSTTPILLPTPSVSVTATGTLTLHRPAQDATTDGRIAFDASVTPDGNSARIVRSSAVVVRASPYSLGGVNFPLILGGLVVASAGGAALGLILRRRQAARAALVAQKRPIPVVVDTRGGTVAESEPADEVGLAQAAAIMECAEVAASECEWRLALDLVASARRLDPRDWQLAATQALWFERAGALDQAMGAYDEARALGMREADVCSAICALKKDDEELAVAYLARAVDLAPENVREITSEPILARLRARADVEALLRSARSRLDAA